MPMRVFLIACLLIAGCGSRASVDFDQERWRNADLGTRERAHMVGSLLQKHPIEGMDRAAVVEVLGEPTPTGKWDGSEMIYVLGPDGSMMPIDHEWLLIELDQQDRVSSYRVVSD
jgi:outer membrane protein assembly factor BamE (lipoprotein component of BamABCDE complex)